ncbi:MAG: Gfo/Idh/MocA family oxidoreductase [Candidatus Latescibacterota bacterium]|nr:Gfo/Idh/MocA family oxidoreductase [Candidatus Latescibacterota bacterium]
MKTYRAVIVGLTGIGARRPEEPSGIPLYGTMPRSHAAAYHRHPDTEVVGVCDLRMEALDQFTTDWSDVWPNCRRYTDYREMLNKEKPDLVSVATSDHVHADITVNACESSARAVLCEKPIATTLEDADRMIAAAADNDVLLSVEHTRRWSPHFHTARELIRSGDLGPLRSLVCSMYSQRAMLFPTVPT